MSQFFLRTIRKRGKQSATEIGTVFGAILARASVSTYSYIIIRMRRSQILAVTRFSFFQASLFIFRCTARKIGHSTEVTGATTYLNLVGVHSVLDIYGGSPCCRCPSPAQTSTRWRSLFGLSLFIVSGDQDYVCFRVDSFHFLTLRAVI